VGRFSFAYALLFAFAIGSSSLWAGEVPAYFTYQGRLLNSSGTAPLTSTVDLKFQIYNPGGTCLLYEELESGVDLSLTAGVFATQVGSGLGSSKRTVKDPALTMSQIFSNRNTSVRLDDSSTTNTCPGGYIGTTGDSRLLRVTVIDGD
jgi:hypothetical protein